MKWLAWAPALVLFVVCSPAFAAPPAPAAPPVAAKPKTLGETLTGQAKADYESARVLIGDGDYAGALIKFQAAYDSAQDPRLLFNVAASEKQLRHYAKAVALPKRYAASASPVVTAKDKEEAAEFIKTLEPFTVAVTIDVTEPAATVEVDDVVVGQSPLPAPVVVDIGQRKFRVRKDGYRDLVVILSLGGSAIQTVPMKLEKELHAGKISLRAPLAASMFIDGQPLPARATADAIELQLPSGGHTLRATAPGMRPFEREVIVKDNEVRTVEVQLEPDAELQRPKLRVAVGCIDSTPRSADEGLAVYIDGSPAATAPSGGKTVWNEDRGRDVIEYVAFPVTTGAHTVQVRIPGCRVAEARVDVRADGGDLRGALPSDSALLVRGPAGSPNWGRIGVSLWLPNTIGAGFKGLSFSSESQGPLRGLKYAPSGTGIAVQPGLAARWATLMLDLAYAGGSAEIASQPAVATPQIIEAVDKPPVRWFRAGMRMGARFPFNVAAFHLGVGSGYDNIVFTKLAPGLSWDKPGSLYGSAWAMLDIHVLCDLPLFAGFHIDVHDDGTSATYGLQFGAAFQPNKVCRAERSTPYELTASPAGAAQ